MCSIEYIDVEKIIKPARLRAEQDFLVIFCIVLSFQNCLKAQTVEYKYNKTKVLICHNSQLYSYLTALCFPVRSILVFTNVTVLLPGQGGEKSVLSEFSVLITAI